MVNIIGIRPSSFRPDKVCKILYKLAKVCKKYYSPMTFKYYRTFIYFCYLEVRFRDTPGPKLELDSSFPSDKKANKYLIIQRIKNNMNAPILCIDFDGVIHSCKSGWKGATNIPDQPVEGAIEWLRSLLGSPVNKDIVVRNLEFRLSIYSVRSRYLFGRRAMKNWLKTHGLTENECRLIDFPLMKPPLYLQIDDRALTFTGIFPTVKEMKDFKPWHKKT